MWLVHNWCMQRLLNFVYVLILLPATLLNVHLNSKKFSGGDFGIFKDMDMLLTNRDSLASSFPTCPLFSFSCLISPTKT